MLIYFKRVTNELFQVVDLLMTFDGEVVKHTPLTGVERHPEELLLD